MPCAAQSEASASSRAKLPLPRRQEALQAQALAPLKQVAMLCFMMWMSGSTLHLFSIMTTLSGIYQPLSGGAAARGKKRRVPGRVQGEWGRVGHVRAIAACPLHPRCVQLQC